MKIKGFVLALLSAFAYSSTVIAGGLINSEPFNGLYIGAQAGYGHVETSTHDPLAGDDRADFGNQGPLYGGLGGWGLTLGSLYLGIEGQYNWLRREADATIDGDAFHFNIEREWNVGPRIGWRVGDNALVYVRGAYTEQELDIEEHSVALMVDTLTGYQGGLGVEFALANFLLIRGEYIYSNYQTGNIEVDGIGPVADINNSSSEGRLALVLEF